MITTGNLPAKFSRWVLTQNFWDFLGLQAWVYLQSVQWRKLYIRFEIRWVIAWQNKSVFLSINYRWRCSSCYHYRSTSTMVLRMTKATLVEFHDQRSTLCSHLNNGYSLRDFETFGDVRVHNFLCSVPPFFFAQFPHLMKSWRVSILLLMAQFEQLKPKPTVRIA